MQTGHAQENFLTRMNDHGMLKLIMMDFAAILVGYNLSPSEARELATKATEVLREEMTDVSLLRRVRFIACH